MVHNPIYIQGPIPLYDTIPTTLSEILNDSETYGASNFSSFKSSSSTSTAANAYYVDELHNSPSQGNPLGNIHTPDVSFNHKDDIADNSVMSTSLECVQKVVADDENGEETYTLMLPGGTVANR